MPLFFPRYFISETLLLIYLLLIDLKVFIEALWAGVVFGCRAAVFTIAQPFPSKPFLYLLLILCFCCLRFCSAVLSSKMAALRPGAILVCGVLGSTSVAIS